MDVMVAQWNEDTIFEVNGVNSSKEDMCNQFENAARLKLKIRRGVEEAEWLY